MNGLKGTLCRFSLFAFALLIISHTANAFDVAVGEIHVTQGIQNNDQYFPVPLVADRSTAVRVSIDRINGTPGPVSGKLRIFVEGQEVGSVDDINRTFPPPHNQFIPPNNPRGFIVDLLDAEENTLNFELLPPNNPLAFADGQVVSDDVDFLVEISAPGDDNLANNVFSFQNFRMIKRQTPWLFKTQMFYFPVYFPSGAGGPPVWPLGPKVWPVPDANKPRQDQILPEVADVMAPAIWPMPDGESRKIFPPLIPGFHFITDCDGDGKVRPISQICPFRGGFVSEDDFVLDRIARSRSLLTRNGFGPGRLTFLYAWVRDDHLIQHLGLALVGLPIGYGTDDKESGQGVYAHELGHNLGFLHNDDIVSYFGWDVGGRLHNNPNAMRHGVSGRVKPRPLYVDVMNDTSYTRNTDDRWIRLDSYKEKTDDTTFALEGRNFACRRFNDPDSIDTLVVYGIPVRNDKGLEYVLTAFRYPWCSDGLQRPDRANIKVTAELQYAESDTVNSRQILTDTRKYVDMTEGGLQTVEFGPFAVALPVPREAKVVSISVAAHGDSSTKAILNPTAAKRSMSPPTIQIIEPKRGATLDDRFVISWNAEDPDKDAQLSFDVAYSPNQGEDFIPLQTHVDDNKVTISVSELPNTEASSGLIRVFVNDGFYTGYSDVMDLSVSK